MAGATGRCSTCKRNVSSFRKTTKARRMTSFPKQGKTIDPLPPALSSMWRLCKLGYRHEPRMMLASLVLSQLSALPDALLALWLMLLGEGVLEHRPGLAEGSAIGLGVSTAATWFLRTVSTRVQRRFRDKVTIALESHVAQLQASIPTLTHQERPEYLDRLSMLRNQVFVLDHTYMSLFSTLGWILRLGVTMALLASIHPALILLVVFAVPTVLTSTWRPEVERSAQERGAQTNRLARHLFTIATTAAPGKEVRVTGIGERLIKERRAAWERWYGPVAAARWGSALWHALAWAIFGFAYAGASRVVLEDVSLTLPAGAVVAIVGENGAGKTTLVKLLAKMYEPSSGSILVDDTPLARVPAAEWRARLAGAFQDFFRFEFRARHTVGLGDVPRLDDEPAVVAAVDRAGARDVVARLTAGLETQLGPTWPGGVELSFGQWQKLALARGFMRDEPLLLILDEPTAALDAETEHALFERFAAAARSRGENDSGRITILVSHRFSTVRMADLILVLDGARLVEVGTHDELMAGKGHYSELYSIQAAAYR